MPKPRRLWWGRKVYKILHSTEENKTDLALSPYRDFEYLIGKRYTSSLHKPTWSWHTDHVEVKIGFHAFTKLEDAREWRDNMQNQSCIAGKVFNVYECYIPFGSDYYTGQWDEPTGPDNIVANRITIKGIVK